MRYEEDLSKATVWTSCRVREGEPMRLFRRSLLLAATGTEHLARGRCGVLMILVDGFHGLEVTEKTCPMLMVGFVSGVFEWSCSNYREINRSILIFFFQRRISCGIE